MNTVRHALVVLMALLWFLHPTGVLADACSPTKPTQSVTAGVSTIVIVTNGISNSVVDAAIQMWNSCVQVPLTMPAFSRGGTGEVTISVTSSSGQSPSSGCGRSIVSTQGGQLVGAEVTIYARAGTGETCTRAPETLAHELGHVLGLADAPQTCDGRIMGPWDPDPQFMRAVTSEDCRVAAERFRTLLEQQHLPDPDGHLCRGTEV